MKIKDLDGKIQTWNLGKYVGKINTNASELHERAREFLHDSLPTIQILEEVYLPGARLFFDFFLPLKKTAIECQGIQHSVYNSHFYKDKLEFYRAKARDNKKIEFCRINGIELIYFYPDESIDQWTTKMNLRKT